MRTWISVASAVLLMSGAGTALAAAEMNEVTVEAGPIGKTVVGHTSLGAPIERMAVDYHVSYADLDLSKDADVQKLHGRVEAAAQNACRQLDELYPLEAPNWRACTQAAINGASPQVQTAVSAASATMPGIVQQDKNSPAAESLPQVTVHAGSTYTVEKVGPSSTMKGASLERVTITRPVSYSDLDLGTADGVAELHKRVTSAAVASCNELKIFARLQTSEGPASPKDCETDAVSGAREQVAAAISAGEKSHHQRYQ
jgi:UrcA family protein